jgi:HSP20 family molecular chaperone IbpA
MSDDGKDGIKGIEALKLISERLGTLFGDLPKTLAEAAATAEATESKDGETVRPFSIPTPSGPVKGMISYGMRSGSLSGTPLRRAGSVPPKAAPRDHEVKRPARPQPAEREPMLDCFDEGDHLLVTVELPGVRESEIVLAFPTASQMDLTTTGAQIFAARRALPCLVDPARIGRSFRNGILELTLPKAAEGTQS